MTHSIHLHFNLFSFPSPVFPLYFSLSSSCLFCALSEAASPSLFLPDSSRSCPRPIPLCSFLCYISLPLLSSVPFAPAISSLCPLSFSLCRHITLAAPISHPLSPETPSFQSSFPRQPLGVDIPHKKALLTAHMPSCRHGRWLSQMSSMRHSFISIPHRLAYLWLLDVSHKRQNWLGPVQKKSLVGGICFGSSQHSPLCDCHMC